MKKHLTSLIFVLLVLSSCKMDEDIKTISLEDDDRATPYISGTSYITDVEDIPLPSGFETDEEKTTIYDAPSGRIIEAYASGKASPKDVIAFYENTLPQLGWKKKVGFAGGGVRMRFDREGEQLRVDIKSTGLGVKYTEKSEYEDQYEVKLNDDIAKLTIRFSLYPAE